MKLIAKVLTALLLLNFGISSHGFAQKCKTSEVRAQNIAKNPAILDEIQRIEAFTQAWSLDQSLTYKTNAVVTIPVVVHVIWQSTAENISDAQVASQMTVMNDDFRKLNSNFSSTPAGFQSIAADSEIEFCLATTDPSGNPTTGITRTQTTVDEIGETEFFYSTSDGGKDPWDNSQYLNIWVCELSPGLLGFATPPGTAVPAQADGVVVAPIYFGTTGTAANSQPNHLGRTATHEVGHYFNLEHVWGPTNGGCGEDDFVADTPNQEFESGGCPTFPLTDNCTSSGDGVNFNNYMDYTDDLCMTMFTAGQKTRMLAAINGPRASLLTGNVCGTTVSVSPEVDFEGKIALYPNPSQQWVTLDISNRQKKSTLHFKLVSMVGKTFLEFATVSHHRIDVSQLPQGVYFLQCEEFPQTTQKLLITK